MRISGVSKASSVVVKASSAAEDDWTAPETHSEAAESEITGAEVITIAAENTRLRPEMVWAGASKA